MPKNPTPQPPTIKLHKPSGRAYIRVQGRLLYLGGWTFDEQGRPLGPSPEALERYQEAIVGWAHRAALPRALRPEGPDPTLTCDELMALFIIEETRFYSVHEQNRCKNAFIGWRALYGGLRVVELGPRRLKTLLEFWADRGLARKTCNGYFQVVKRVLKWAASEEYIDPGIYHGAQSVSGLRWGRSNARETEPVQPVPQADIDAVLAIAPSPIAALVRLQLYTAARPSELLNLKRGDVPTEGAVWRVEIREHKNRHHGKRRVLWFGPKAQAVIRPFLVRKGPDAYLFDPRDTVAEQAAAAAGHRRPGQRPTPRQTPRRVGERYTPASYGRAIKRLCGRAGVPHWNPYRLRHNAATLARAQFGLDGAQAFLGHSQAVVTEVYASLSEARAAELAAQIG